MKKTQTGWVFLLLIPAIATVVTFANTNTTNLWIMWVISAVILLLFYRLTIKVDDKHVSFVFGIGLIRGKYQLSDITNCKPISYAAMGWGIRLRPGAILYNVSGNKAIALTLRNRERKVWIGTNTPNEIAEFINNKIMPAS